MRTVWEHGWWETATAPPHPALRAMVHGEYAGWTEQTSRPVRRREVASTFVPLIINFGAPYRVFSGVDAGATSVERSSFAAGLYDTWAAVEGPTSSCALQVNLTPFAAHRLLRTPMHVLTNGSHDAVALLGRAGRDLVERLGNCVGWPSRFALLDAFLVAQLAHAPAVASELQWAWSQLETTGGRVPIATLVQQTRWSPRRLIAAFHEHCGLPPRAIAGLRRFGQVVQRIESTHAPMRGRWSALALDCGYADQSHLIRDFTRFAGCTPTAYLRGRLASGGGNVDADAIVSD